MGKGTTLTKEEIGQIQAYREQGKSIRFIASEIGRGATVVHSFMKDPEKYGKNRKGRVSEATTYQERRAILTAASNSRLSVSKIKAETGVTASRSTVHRVIQEARHIRHEKMKRKPPLNAEMKTPGRRAQSLTSAVVNLDLEEKIPTEHILDLSVVTKQTLGVFSHAVPNESSKDNAVPEMEKHYMEGRIVQKMECRPIANNCYMKLKLESIRKASVPHRRVQALDKVVQNFKPVKDHKHNVECKERKKAEGKKARDDKKFVLDMLFNAFEKHQYYNIKDLVKITKQPIGYLKEILKEVCDYNMKNPHKNMWELKKEYRHYKTAEEKKDKKSPSDSDTG